MTTSVRTTFVRVSEGSSAGQTMGNGEQCVKTIPTNGDIAFIHLSHPDDSRRRSLQTTIRRHVMRDIGKSRRRKRRPVTIPLTLPANETRSDHHDHRYVHVRNSSPFEIAARVSSVYAGHPDRSLGPLGSFVIEPDVRVRQLFHFSKSDSTP